MSFREDYDTRGLVGKPAGKEKLPEGWERMFSAARDQYYFFHEATATIQWVEDNQSFPVGPFLLGDAPARGKLIHQGDGLRDSAGPEPIKAGTKVLPHEYGRTADHDRTWQGEKYRPRTARLQHSVPYHHYQRPSRAQTQLARKQGYQLVTSPNNSGSSWTKTPKRWR